MEEVKMNPQKALQIEQMLSAPERSQQLKGSLLMASDKEYES